MTQRENWLSLMRRQGYEFAPVFFFLCPHQVEEYKIKRQVWKNLDIAGSKGGLWCTPTHILEPEVPWENIMAYVEACKEYHKVG